MIADYIVEHFRLKKDCLRLLNCVCGVTEIASDWTLIYGIRLT